MESFKQIHERALVCAKRFLQAEAELLGIIQIIEAKKIFRDLGYSSVFHYATEALKLSDSQAYCFINVARKSKEVPELKKAITDGKITLSKAHKIVSVIHKENSKEWIQKAAILTQKQVEREVVKENPLLETTERIRPIAEERVELRCGLSAELEAKLKRAQDLLSQKNRKSCSLEETLDAALSEFLDRFDPVQKAKRAVAKVSVKPTQQQFLRTVVGRKPLPAALLHKIQLRDEGRCAFVHEGKRCRSERWLEIHHILPVSHGGTNSLANLTTLCSTHHKHQHGATAGMPLSPMHPGARCL